MPRWPRRSATGCGSRKADGASVPPSREPSPCGGTPRRPECCLYCPPLAGVLLAPTPQRSNTPCPRNGRGRGNGRGRSRAVGGRTPCGPVRPRRARIPGRRRQGPRRHLDRLGVRGLADERVRRAVRRLPHAVRPGVLGGGGAVRRADRATGNGVGVVAGEGL